MPGESSGFHDYGESSGAFVVATGILEENRLGEQPFVIPPGKCARSVPITRMTFEMSPSPPPFPAFEFVFIFANSRLKGVLIRADPRESAAESVVAHYSVSRFLRGGTWVFIVDPPRSQIS